jgi:uncharacterized protein
MPQVNGRTVPMPDQTALVSVCRRHHIRTLRLFGSALRSDFRPDSDIDLLVEFEPGHIPGFLHLHKIADDLSALMQGRRVDLVTLQALHPHLRDRVLNSAEVLFAA